MAVGLPSHFIKFIECKEKNKEQTSKLERNYKTDLKTTGRTVRAVEIEC